MNNHFIRALVNYRERCNYTQEKMANYLGVTRICLANWETGRSFPTVDGLINLSRKLNISLDALIGNDVYTNDSMLKQFQFALYGEVKDLSKNEQDEILRLVKSYKSLLEQKK